METLEQKAWVAGGSFHVDLDEGPDSEWCVIMVTPSLIERIREISTRTGKTMDEVLVAAVVEYGKAKE